MNAARAPSFNTLPLPLGHHLHAQLRRNDFDLPRRIDGTAAGRRSAGRGGATGCGQPPLGGVLLGCLPGYFCQAHCVPAFVVKHLELCSWGQRGLILGEGWGAWPTAAARRTHLHGARCTSHTQLAVQPAVRHKPARSLGRRRPCPMGQSGGLVQHVSLTAQQSSRVRLLARPPPPKLPAVLASTKPPRLRCRPPGPPAQ